jgi:hypothetical protein
VKAHNGMAYCGSFITCFFYYFFVQEQERQLLNATIGRAVIHTPEVFEIDNTDYYDKIYPENYQVPRQLITMEPFAMETEFTDYDMDSEDELWLSAQSSKLELTPDKVKIYIISLVARRRVVTNLDLILCIV